MCVGVVVAAGLVVFPVALLVAAVVTAVVAVSIAFSSSRAVARSTAHASPFARCTAARTVPNVPWPSTSRGGSVGRPGGGLVEPAGESFGEAEACSAAAHCLALPQSGVSARQVASGHVRCDVQLAPHHIFKRGVQIHTFVPRPRPARLHFGLVCTLGPGLWARLGSWALGPDWALGPWLWALCPGPLGCLVFRAQPGLSSSTHESDV